MATHILARETYAMIARGDELHVYGSEEEEA
jgi:hypothetical protein